MARPRARAALRRARPRGHDRLPQRLRRSRPRPPRRSPTRSTIFPGFNGPTARVRSAGYGATDRRSRLPVHVERWRVSSMTRSRDTSRPPHALRPRRRDHGSSATSIACRPRPTRAACGCGRTPRRTSRREFARVQIERGAVGICCAKLGEAEVFARRRHRGHPAALSAEPGQRRPRARARSSATRLSFIVDDPAVARGWSDAMRARAAASVDVLVKVDVGFHRCGIDPAARRRAGASWRAIAAMPGLRFRGLLSHAGHAYGAVSDARARGHRRSGSAACCNDLAAACRRSACRARRSASARRRRRASPCKQDGRDRDAAGQLRLLRPHAGGARRRGVGRLRADRAGARRQPSGARSRDPRQRQQDADERSARGFGDTPGYGAVLRGLDVAEPDPSLIIERLSEEHANGRASTATTALRTGDLVRIVPNHSCVVSNLVDARVARGRRPRDGAAAGGGARADHIVESTFHGKGPARRSARPRGNARPGRHD